MTVRDYYVDSSVTGPGTGTRLDPFSTLTLANASVSHTSGDVNRIHMKSGSTFVEKVPPTMANTVGLGLHMDVYGGSNPVSVDATTDVTSSWTYNSTFDFFTAPLGTNQFYDDPGLLTIGALLEDGQCMPFQMYNANHAILRTTLEGGGYSYNKATGIVYMVPTSAGAHTYRAAQTNVAMSINEAGPFSVSTLSHYYKWNKFFEGVRFVGGKFHGVLVGTSKVKFEDCLWYASGGMERNVTFVGNGIEATNRTNVLVVRNCSFDQIFDSAVTAQTYENDATCKEVLIEYCRITRAGLAGLEFSIQGGNVNTSLNNITARYNYIGNSGGSFAPAVYAQRYSGIGVVLNGLGTLDYINIHHNTLEDLLGFGITVARDGTRVYVDHNTIRRTGRGIYEVHNASSSPRTTNHFYRHNIISECPEGIRTNHLHTVATASFISNSITDCPLGFVDISTANSAIELTDNEFDVMTPISATRTTGITGSGNTSTTPVDPTYSYLFT